jgi:hypothetical protein
MNRRVYVWALPLLLGLSLGSGCSGGSQNVNGGGGGAIGPESTPQVEYIGPQNAAQPGAASPELLFTTPGRPAGDLGTVRVTCAGAGCSYSAASAAMTAKAREIGASGVHSIKEASGNMREPMDAVAAKNGRVFNLAGTAFAYSN